MALEKDQHIIDNIGAIVALTVMMVYALTMLAPYGLAMLGIKVDPIFAQTIKDNKNTVDLITTAVVMFFFGASVQRRKDQDTMGTLVKTNAAQVAALAPVIGASGSDTMVIPADTTATVTTTDDGAAVIHKEPNP